MNIVDLLKPDNDAWVFERLCETIFVVVDQELTKREVEYVALSRDTTETDLKQRREIRSGTAFYIDQVNPLSDYKFSWYLYTF